MSGSGSQNYTSPNFVIPYTMPSYVPANMVYLIKPIYIAFQNIMQNLIYYCGVAPRNPANILTSNNDPTAILANNMHRFYTQASETISEGAPVNLFAVLGSLQVQNANGVDGTKPADGFCSQTGGIAAGSVGEVILNDGVNFSLVSLTPGTRYYLSAASPGEYTPTPPTAAGNLQQSLGIALTATSLKFWTGDQVQH